MKNKPIKLLVIAPNQIDGTSWYRVFGVVKDLERYGIQYDQVTTMYSWATLQEYDAVLLQRPFNDQSYQIASIVKEAMIPLILDYDDDLLNVHPDNPAHKHFESVQVHDAIQSICKLADGIIVSNPRLAEIYGQWCDNIVTVPNAIDDKYWQFKREPSKNDMIFYRGSMSHIPDLAPYNDDIHTLIQATENEWGFMGYPVDGFRYKELPQEAKSRIKHWGWMNLPHYMRSIHKVNPKISWFPLANNDFNKRKSNIAWLEASYAGAAFITNPDFAEFDYPGVTQVEGVEPFIEKLKEMAEGDVKKQVLDSQKVISEKFLLSKVNEKRANFIRKITEKYTPILVEPGEIASEDVEPYTDKEMFDHQKVEHTIENPPFKELMEAFVDFVMKQFKPRSILELGCGTGALIELFKKKGVDIIGVDSNPHCKEYWDERNPKAKDRFVLANLNEYVIPENRAFDLVISIECFEHMTMQGIHNITEQISERGKAFIFSSNPSWSNPVFDKRWGHISVMATETWAGMFQNYNMTYRGQLQIPTEQTMYLTSNKFFKDSPGKSQKEKVLPPNKNLGKKVPQLR